VTDSSHPLLRKMIRAWPLDQQRRFFEETIGIPLVEEVESAKLFPASHKARDVRDGLLAHARSIGVRLAMDTRVTAVTPRAPGWDVSPEHGEVLHGDAVIIATGGVSVPATGSDGFGLDMLAALGHTMQPTYAALTPVLSDDAVIAELSGISLRVTLSARSALHEARAAGGFLFTHRGFSGPSVLDVSHVLVRAGATQATARLQICWTALKDAEWEVAFRPHGARTVSLAVRSELPDRLAGALIAAAGVDPTRSLAELRREERLRLIDTLVRGELPWTGDEGYKKAEVTGGGVDLREVHAHSMESRRHRGLFLCGEVLDAFGPIGGYNFLWAWATGRAAGLGAAAHAS
jgi:predicted Rossmann fold flavoprotein